VRSICVLCGSNPGRRPEYVAAAAALAETLVDRGMRVVYGGAAVGTMGALADAALRGGGEVVGVIPQALVDAEVAHPGLTELRVVGSMHERKAEMVALSDGFVALPGGLGTLDELAEVATWSQLGLHAKPIGLLDPLGYFDLLLRFLDHAVAERFLRGEHRGLLLHERTPAALLAAMAAWTPAAAAKWVDADGVPIGPAPGAALDGAAVCALMTDLGLPAGQYVVCGSAAMAVRGLRAAGDIDLLVLPGLYAQLERSGWHERRFPGSDRPRALHHGPFDAATTWSVGAFRPDPARLIADAEVIDGIAFVPLATVAAWKRACGRPKDLADLDLIAADGA
jgi:uncharacterized protein (TIGR00730 family)